MQFREYIEGDEYEEVFESFKNDRRNKINKVGKILGKGPRGEVKEIETKDKVLAGKIIKKFRNEKPQNEEILKDLNNEHIVKIEKILSKKINNTEYELILMERAQLKDLGKVNDHFYNVNLLRLINIDPFDEKISNCLLRFYARQIISALEILHRNNYVHLRYEIC